MNYSAQNDETLVTLTLAGNQKAYETLVLRYEKRVHATAYAVTHNNYMAEDAAQDAFVTAWIKLNMLREPDKFAAWVCRIATNCAKSMLVRFREYMDIELIEDTYSDVTAESLDDMIISSEENDMLHGSIDRLPEKVKQIIHLHYFEGLSIAEIAARMMISVGTVKSQLHDGRKKIRKDLSAMNEHIDDTLVVKVMKKVEELKNWRLKNNRDGFEKAYNSVLKEVEALPESVDKLHALADVLMHGWWWLPGEKNDALFTRIKEAAICGKNDNVISFIVNTEDHKLSDEDKIEFMLNTQIPFLEKHGFTHALGQEWFWLGFEYFRAGRSEEGFAAYDKVLRILPTHDMYYPATISARQIEQLKLTRYSDINQKSYHLHAIAEEYRFLDGTLRFWSQPGYGIGRLTGIDPKPNYIFSHAARCDRYFFIPQTSVGYCMTGSDGTTLTFTGEHISVNTPCGSFDDCELWTTQTDNTIYKTYYKRGIGIVRQETYDDISGLSERILSNYNVKANNELLPFAAGNTWEYIDLDNPSFNTKIVYEITHADTKVVTASIYYICERLKYDENSWDDMICNMQENYFEEIDNQDRLIDVSAQMEHILTLATTPYQLAYTKAACDVMRRILNTDATFNPNRTQSGHWNFFKKSLIHFNNGSISMQNITTSHFTWKAKWHTPAGNPMFFNDILGILNDGTGFLWSDEWKDGTCHELKTRYCNSYINTRLVCQNAGSITTPAGTFDNCLKLSLDINGLERGFKYRGGKKDYYFAPSIGIIRTVTPYFNNTLNAVYDLTAYEGTGSSDCYMPIEEGMLRRYDAQALMEGFEGWSEYNYVKDDHGNMCIIENRCGVKKL